MTTPVSTIVTPADESSRSTDAMDASAIDRVTDGYWEVSPDGGLMNCNQSARRMLGLGLDENVTGIEILSLFPSAHRQDIAAQLATPSATRLEIPLVPMGRTPYLVQLRLGQIADPSGTPVRIFGVMKDITAADHSRRRFQELQTDMELVMSRSNQMAVEAEVASVELNQIFNTASDGLWILGLDHTVLRTNPAILAMLGRNRDDVVGKKCHEVMGGPFCHTDECPVTKIKNQNARRMAMDLTLRFADRELPVSMNATPFRGLENELVGVLVNYRDITDRHLAEEALQRANAELERLATIDGLTGLCNRRHLDALMSLEWKRLTREQSPLSVILCDVDYFKKYNDTYGHQMGDECLKLVATALAGCARRPADFAARYGGEEFVLALPNTIPDGAVLVADQARRAIQDLLVEHTSSDVAEVVTLSLGVATMIPNADTLPSDLIEMADQALYEAKEGGRNRVVFRGHDPSDLPE